MRVLSDAFRAALFAQESGEVPVHLLTITHPDLDEPIRLSSDPTTRTSTDPLIYGTVSRGNTYLYLPMELSLPDEADGSPPAAKFIVSNVSRELIPLARSVTSPPSVLWEIALASDLESIEVTFPELQMINLQYDAAQLMFDLALDAYVKEPFPAGSFDPAGFPGLFV